MNIGLTCLKKRSKRFPGKHHLKFNDTTLFEHNLNIMTAAECLDIVYVCTDDERIWATIKNPDIMVIKEPQTLAQLDNSWRVINWVVNSQKFHPNDILFYLPSTAPLRTSEDIEKAYKIFKKKACTSLVSVRECRDPPEWSFPIKLNRLSIDSLKMTSQEQRPYYCLNGSIYISTVKNLKRYDGYFGGFVIPYIMPYERSVDIDSPPEFEKAAKYYKEILKDAML